MDEVDGDGAADRRPDRGAHGDGDAMLVAQLRVLGGAAARVPADATAYAHRDARIMGNVAALVSQPDELAEHEPWVDAFAASSAATTTGRYVNFVARRAPDGSTRPIRVRRGTGWRRSSAATTRTTCSTATRTSRRPDGPRPAAAGSVAPAERRSKAEEGPEGQERPERGGRLDGDEDRHDDIAVVTDGGGPSTRKSIATRPTPVTVAASATVHHGCAIVRVHARSTVRAYRLARMVRSSASSRRPSRRSRAAAQRSGPVARSMRSTIACPTSRTRRQTRPGGPGTPAVDGARPPRG